MDKSVNSTHEFKRKYTQSIKLNEHEMSALLSYCKKYRVKNKAKFFRETIFTHILKKFDQDYPSLF